MNDRLLRDNTVVEEMTQLRLQKEGIEYGTGHSGHRWGQDWCVANQCASRTISIYTL